LPDYAGDHSGNTALLQFESGWRIEPVYLIWCGRDQFGRDNVFALPLTAAQASLAGRDAQWVLY
jgi:hypothetical protein